MSTSSYSDLYFGHYTKVKGNTWDFGTSKLTNIAEPLVSTDVSTKNYVDINRQQQGQNLRAYADAGDLTVSNAYKAADVSLKAAVDADIAAVQAKVDSILAGADINTDSLKEIADLAKTLNAGENASLISSVASLQSQITSNDSDISDLKTLTTAYATEFDTALIVKINNGEMVFKVIIRVTYILIVLPQMVVLLFVLKIHGFKLISLELQAFLM